MKNSKYNYIINKENLSYWFNGITKHHFRLDIDLSNKLKNSLANIDSLETNAPNFYKNLTEKGFIVDNNVDELEIIREKNKKTREANHYFLIVIPTMNCNFDCWYCVQDHVETLMSNVTIQKVKNHIQKMVEVEKISSLHLEWFGGEPFLYFKEVIVPISEYASSLCENAGITFLNTATTNAYYVTPDIHLKLKELKFKRFQITLDGCRVIHNKVKNSKDGNSAFDITLNNINELANNIDDLKVLLRINYTNDNLQNNILEEVNEIISVKNRGKIEIMFRKVWQEKADKTRAEKVYKLADHFKNDGYCDNKNDLYKGFITCYADRYFYNTINYDGSVLKCTANDDLENADAPGVLQNDGSITWKEGFLEDYYKVRFENEMCLKCKNLPLCMGHCGRDYKLEPLKEITCKVNKIDTNFNDLIIHYIEKEYAEIDK